MGNTMQKLLDERDFENEAAIAQYLMEHTGKANPEYLVRGALMRCRHGTHARRLNLTIDHGVYFMSSPVIHSRNCKCGEGENISPFGVCKSPTPPPTPTVTYTKDVPRDTKGNATAPAPGGVERGPQCEPCILEFKWQRAYEKTRIVDNGEINPGDRALVTSGEGIPTGEAALTTLSFLVCLHGGLIEPLTSGQEITSVSKEATEDAFIKNLQKQFGFDEKTGQIMWNVYEKLQEKYPNASQGEADWRFARLMGGLQYDDDKLQWDSTAGRALDQAQISTSGVEPQIVYPQMPEKTYFIDFLGIPEEDYALMRYKVRVQNQIVSSPESFLMPEKCIGLKDKQLDNLKNWMASCEAGTGLDFNSEQEFLDYWNRQYQQFQGRGDFAHQQITTAAILATPLEKDGLPTDIYFLGNDEKREDMAGWLGDATLDDNGGISFGGDDYQADLDAENITAMMAQTDMSYTEAFNRYYERLDDGESRADIFLEHTSLEEVKSKIYEELVYDGIEARIAAAKDMGDLKMAKEIELLYHDDSYLMSRVRLRAPDTYHFIKSLEHGDSQMQAYP